MMSGTSCSPSDCARLRAGPAPRSRQHKGNARLTHSIHDLLRALGQHAVIIEQCAVNIRYHETKLHEYPALSIATATFSYQYVSMVLLRMSAAPAPHEWIEEQTNEQQNGDPDENCIGSCPPQSKRAKRERTTKKAH